MSDSFLGELLALLISEYTIEPSYSLAKVTSESRCECKVVSDEADIMIVSLAFG